MKETVTVSLIYYHNSQEIRLKNQLFQENPRYRIYS